MTRNELLSRSDVMQRIIREEFKGVRGVDVVACALFTISIMSSESLCELVKPESVAMEALFTIYNCDGECIK